MNENKPLQQVIAEKSGMLNKIIQAKFGGNPDATASSGQENQMGGGNTMKVTRSQSSGAPGEVKDGKLVDVKALAAAAANQDVPATDLLALARANDPHNESSTLASVVTAAEGLPGQEVAQDNSNTGALGNLETTQKTMLKNKQHPAAENAVDTQVESQVTTNEPYKNLHASAEVDQIVARAKAVIAGAAALKLAATEVEHPGAGKVEDGGQGKVGDDAGKNALESAKTLGDGGAEKGANLSSKTLRKDVVASIKAEMARRAKVEGALVDPAGGPAAQEPEAAAASMGDGGKEKSAAVTAEKKDRPVQQMPEGKPRYEKDEDNRDEEASSYWSKNKADERRFDKEPAIDRPISRELQEKLPALAVARRELLTRIAGLQNVLAASDDAASRLHLKRRHYKQDECGDMDYAGAAGKTKGEISTEHSEREHDTHPFSPMMSRLWAAYGPVKTATDTGYKGKLEKAEGRDELRRQVEEWKTAVKGIKSEDESSKGKIENLHKQIETGEKELAKASGVAIGLPFVEAMGNTLDRLAVIAGALGDINELAEDSHKEMKSSKDKPHGTGTSDSTLDLLEALGETVEDMEDTIDKLLKEMGHPGLAKKKDKAEKAEHAEMGKDGPPKPEIADELPGAGGKGPMDFGAEDAAVEQIAADSKLDAVAKRAQIEELRRGAEWKAQFTKVASKEDKTKADILASRWEVLRNGESVLRLSLADAYPVKTAEKQSEAFAWFATKDYGRKLLASVKFEGLGKTAKLLGVNPMVKSAAGAFNEYTTKRPGAPERALEGDKGSAGLEGKDLVAYYTKAFGSSEFARELVKQHEQKQAMAVELDALKKKVASQTERNDSLQKDMQMRAKAARALVLSETAIAKGLLTEAKKASFIDKLMVSDEASFAVTAEIVESMNKMATKPEEKGKDKEDGEGKDKKEAGKVSARDLIRMAAAGSGLKTATVLPASSTGAVGLTDQLQSMWRKPPTAQ